MRCASSMIWLATLLASSPASQRHAVPAPRTATPLGDWMEVLGTKPTRGGIFVPATVEGNVYRRLPAQIILVRPKDKGWDAIVAEWNDLKRRESGGGRPAPGTAKGTFQSKVAEGLSARGPMAAVIGAVADVLGSWKTISSIAKPERTPKEGEAAARRAFLPVVGQVGYRMGKWLKVRRQRVELEQTMARQLRLQRGTIHVEGQPDLQVLLKTMPDGKTYVVVFGEE